MQKKVLIIGSHGMLGSELVKAFQADSSYEVIGWGREDIDIGDENQCGQKIKALRPDVIINAAANNAVDRIEESDDEYRAALKINAQGPKNLAEAAKPLGGVFVHYGSDFVFGGEKESYKEDDTPNPISRYGETKAEGEQKVKQVGGKYYLVRTSRLFGSPSTSKNAKKSFFETMFNLAKNNKSLKVVDSEKSCFTYAPDLAKATKGLLEGNYPYGVYHLKNEGAVTWYEGLVKFFQLVDIRDVEITPVAPEEFPRSAKRPKSSVLINAKFPKLRNYEEAMKDWINTKNNGLK